MTTATISFAVPCDILGKDPAVFLQPDVGPTWPQEQREVTMHDLRPELEHPETARTPLEQLETRGFAAVRIESEALGPLARQKEWNAAYLEETKEAIKSLLGASDVFIWNSVTRSSDPDINTPYSGNLRQLQPIEGLQFPELVRPTASGAHVDQDPTGSLHICKLTVGEDIFKKYSRVQQINAWRPLKGPVTSHPLAVCDGTTFCDARKGYACGMFAPRINVFYGDEQKWYYIRRQEPDECILLKLYDSKTLPGQSEYAPHTGIDDLHGIDGPESPRESIEIRLVVCYA
ncbi:hypothetical protein GQ53DRAFT_23822 [Thozetella sp. PMI_491]|nr:hypothetical protein GQ53DRAFT_23822 [Thozetella sp. PMI_491]